jgi:hypothetical protein
MTEPEEVKPRRRRTRQEVQRLVGEFGTSGLSRGEFCRIHGMTLSTLQRGLKRERTEPSDIQSDGKRLVRVTRIYVALGATDMRKGFDGLYGIVRDGSDWKSGAVICSCLLIRGEIDLKFFTGMVVAFGFAQKD